MPAEWPPIYLHFVIVSAVAFGVPYGIWVAGVILSNLKGRR
jgi:hypothetical protein